MKGMADYSNIHDSCDLEISECPEAHLETTQDLELLAQEIAEAAVEERRSSNTPSPTPTQLSPTQPECEEVEDKIKDEEDQRLQGGARDKSDLDEEKGERSRSESPVDEASWVLVSGEVEIDNGRLNEEARQRKPPECKCSIFRKFLARGDLRQKLADIGLTCDTQSEHDVDSLHHQDVFSVQDIVVSCSESMVICNMPQPQVVEEDEEEEEEHKPQVFLKDLPDCPKLGGWSGTFSGAQVMVEVELQGGLVVAGVTVMHSDLLSALVSLQHLVTSTGLVSYADIDVPSLLARAA
ncbi:uncharacterized protein [Cherax quadricarinatus]